MEFFLFIFVNPSDWVFILGDPLEKLQILDQTGHSKTELICILAKVYDAELEL